MRTMSEDTGLHKEELEALRRRVAELEAGIGHLRNIEDALRESQERYRLLFENAGEGIMVGAGGYIRLANRKALEITGYTLEELKRMNLYEFIHPDDRLEVLELTQQVMAGKKPPGRFQFRAVAKDGTIKWIENSSVVINWRGLFGGLNFISDITEKKEIEKALERSRVELEQRVAERTAELKEANRKLIDYQEQLRRLTSELALTESRQRRVLAAELHDNIGQALTMAKMRAEILKKSVAGSEHEDPVDKLGLLLGDAVEALRSLIMDISPPILSIRGFEAGLAWLAESMQQKYGLAVESEDDGQEKQMPEDIRDLLYRAVRELIFNAVRHARPSKIIVRSGRTNGRIMVEVEDDGSGFDPASVMDQDGMPSGYGLFSIRERLQPLGGEVEIISGADNGTTVRLSIPLSEESSSK